MPENLGYQFNRLYPAPIETNRQVNTISDRNAIPMSIRWEGMFVYVISESTTFELVGGTDNTKWTVKEGIGEAPIDGEMYGRKDGQWEVISGGGYAEPYLVYTALISQSGTNDPTVVVLRNTLGENIVWTRASAGNYSGTITDPLFASGKTVCFLTSGNNVKILRMRRTSNTTVQFTTTVSISPPSTTDEFQDINLEIRVYP